MSFRSSRGFFNAINIPVRRKLVRHVLPAVASALIPALSGAQAVKSPSIRTASVVASLGVVEEGSRDNAFAFGAHGTYDAWINPRFAVGGALTAFSAFDTGCDEACNARTWGYGLLARGSVAIGPSGHERRAWLGAGVGPVRAQYSERYVLEASGVRQATYTVPAVAADLTVIPKIRSGMMPTISLRALLLPNRGGVRARYVALGIGLITK
jgi:hypothetical protein